MADGAFFMSPEQVMQAEQQLRANQAMQRGVSPLGAQAQELGRSIAGAFGGALGAPMQESPDVALARSRMEAIKSVDPTNRDSFKVAAAKLYQAGDLQGAATIMSQMPELVDIPGKFVNIPGEDKTGQPTTTLALANEDTGEIIKTLGTGPKRGQTINVGGERYESKAKVDIAQKDFEAVRNRGDAAEKTLATIDQARTLLSDETFQTGRLEPLKTEISAFAESLGLDPTRYGLQAATTPQQFRAAINGLVLSKASQMKGNLSDKDVRFLKESEASLASTKDANKLMLDAGKAMAELERQRAEYYNKLIAREDVPITQINIMWKNSPSNVPVVGKNKSGQPVFWNQYFDAMISANATNPDYSKQDGTFDREKLMKDISNKWKKDYAIK